jgi:hypothetical protein
LEAAVTTEEHLRAALRILATQLAIHNCYHASEGEDAPLDNDDCDTCTKYTKEECVACFIDAAMEAASK